MIYIYVSHVPLDSLIEGILVRSRRSVPLPVLYWTPRAEGGAGTLRAESSGGVGESCVVDVVANETTRQPASNSLSVSPCLRALRVSRPEAHPPGPVAMNCDPPAVGYHAPSPFHGGRKVGCSRAYANLKTSLYVPCFPVSTM